ncbi:phage-related protein [Xylella fastidiosa Temecula1]|uniref:Phage-related protein n=1 Tax=Xylella fastidiosa (strain Temecula1 / ATCC 700964) TaxID=183190 RepID=Q87C98_XYLFT|nr:phage-related protein [Xylella fastidiosa Temecula1]
MTQKNALMISAATPATSTPSIHLSRSISPFISAKRVFTCAKRWSMFFSTCAKRVFTCAKPSFISASRRANALPFLDSDSARPCKFISSTSAKASASASAWAAGTPAVFSRFANLSVSNATDVTQSPALAPCGGEYSSVPPTHPEVLHGALA